MPTQPDQPTPMVDPHPRPGWLGSLGWLPAIAALTWCAFFAIGMPEPAEWWFVRLEDQPPFTFDALLATEHPAYLVHRVVYATLIATGISFEVLRFAPFVVALACFVLARALLRNLVARSSPDRWLGEVLLAGWIFHPTWGANWLLFGRYREFLPLALLPAALLLLHGRRDAPRGNGWGRRWLAALVCVWLAQASHATGLCAFLAIGPAVCSAARRHAVPHPVRSAVVFVGWAAIGAVAVWYGLRGTSVPGLVSYVAADPSEVLRRSMALTVDAMPPVFDGFTTLQGAVVWGVAALLLLVAILFQRPFDARRGFLVTLTIYGAISFATVVDKYHAARPVFGVPPREFVQEGLMGVGALFFGMAGLLHDVAKHWWQPLGVVILGGSAVLLARDWQLGFEHLKTVRCMLRTQQAEVSLKEAVPQFRDAVGAPADATGLEARILSPDVLAALRKSGSLATAPRLPGLDLAAYPAPEAAPCGEFLGLIAGKMRGRVTGTLRRPAPRLVYLVRQREGRSAVVGLLRPDFLASTRRVDVTGDLPPMALFRPGDQLLAYGLELQPLALRPLRGTFAVTATGLQQKEGAK